MGLIALVVVIEDKPVLMVLATNAKEEGVGATPAAGGVDLFIRGGSHVF